MALPCCARKRPLLSLCVSRIERIGRFSAVRTQWSAVRRRPLPCLCLLVLRPQNRVRVLLLTPAHRPWNVDRTSSYRTSSAPTTRVARFGHAAVGAVSPDLPYRKGRLNWVGHSHSQNHSSRVSHGSSGVDSAQSHSCTGSPRLAHSQFPVFMTDTRSGSER
eukprot:COSAG02_NODE_792_length_17157_cov_6.602122_3_plen_162_part_00